MSLIKKDHAQRTIKKDVLYATDPISQKGQKIAAAIYLVTKHIIDTDPIKNSIRQCAVTLSRVSLLPLYDDGNQVEKNLIIEAIINIQTLLGVLLIGQLISEKNYVVLKTEVGFFIKSLEIENTISSQFVELTSDFFTIPERTQQGSKKDNFQIPKGHIIKSFNINRTTNSLTINNKTDRSREIIDTINTKKIVSIKDISLLFPSVSEKTIQRELNKLLAHGKIKKRGNKRWSMYLSLDA